MKIDFRKIEVTDLEGNKSTVDVSKSFGNVIYQNTGDIGELELAREIYKSGEVDLSPEQAEGLKRYTPAFERAFMRLAVNNALSAKE